MSLSSGLHNALQEGLLLHSPAAMEALGFGLSQSVLPLGGCLALYGDVGVGKTTLVRGLARARGIPSITSPSFNYYFFYNQCPRPLLHLDAYRLSSAQQFPSLMLDELLTPETLFVIEWPENLGAHLPAGALCLQLGILRPGVHSAKWLPSIL